MHKTCTNCSGNGYVTYYDDLSAWSKLCKKCNGTGINPITNGDIIRQSNNEEIQKILNNLNKWAIYSGGTNNRLLFKDKPEDLTLWLNKETDSMDMETIFNFINYGEHNYGK